MGGTVNGNAAVGRLDVSALVPEDLTGLVPEDYKAYRSVIRSCLRFFLGRLPATRLSELAEASRAAPDAPVADRVLLILRSFPTLHKLGQVVARDHRLSPDFRRRLQILEVLPPSLPRSTISDIVHRELPTLPPTVELGDHLLAEASVAAVLPFRWRQTGRSVSVDGVFKVLKPQVVTRLRQELAIWPQLGEFLEGECRRHGLPTPDYRNAIERVRELLELEVRLDLEQEHLATVAREVGRQRGVETPSLLPFCTPRVTAMTRLDGVKVTTGTTGRYADRLATRVVETLIADPVLQPRGPAIFHADPHAGNLLDLGRGRLGILDWSLVGRLAKDQRILLTQILFGAITLDGKRIGNAVQRLASGSPDREGIDRAVAAALDRLRGGTWPGVEWLFGLLDELAFGACVQFPGDLILFRKGLLTLRGVVEDLSPGFSIDRVMARRTFERMLRDWPRRWTSGPFSRNFGTHLSNLDLLRLTASGPATFLRFVSRTLQRFSQR